MPKLISEMTNREIRARRIEVRRETNAIARRLGFKNYRQMTGDDQHEAED